MLPLGVLIYAFGFYAWLSGAGTLNENIGSRLQLKDTNI